MKWPMTFPAIGVKLETTVGVDVAPTPIHCLAVIGASAGYVLAAAVAADLAAMGVPVLPSRPGDSLFDHDTIDRLEAAGCVIEDTATGVTIHLPNRAGSVDGRGLAYALSKPLTADDFRDIPHFAKSKPPSSAQSYLRHDPTKQHRLRRKRR